MDNLKYQCMYCSYLGIKGTIMFDYKLLRMFFVEMFVEHYVQYLENQYPNMMVQIIENSYQCGYCQREFGKLVKICLGEHKISQSCLKSSSTNGLKVEALISLLGNEAFIFNIKAKLEAFGFFLNFCSSCGRKVQVTYNPNNDQLETLCTCGVKICNNCKRIGHYGKTCLHFESSQEYEVIDLKPPRNIDRPEGLKEQEYLNAKYAFENFLETPGSRFKGAKMIVNKALEDRYALKKREMALKCGGEDKINEIYVWHGSKLNLYDKIMRGLKVGGIDGIPISSIYQIEIHGYGVNFSTTPDATMQYAKDSNFILGLAIKGIRSPNKVHNPSDLFSGRFHSYKPLGPSYSSWKVIFTKEQVLPRWLVEFTR